MKLYNKQKILLFDLDTSKEIARGGEGMIIDHGTEVIKLYLPGIKGITEDKFNDLAELKSNIFIKPEKLVYNVNGKILGFTMNKVSSDHFPILSFFNKTFCNRENISDKVKLNVAEKLIDAMKFAHSKNIVIGDYNPYNILVNETGSVYLIDVDSYETPNGKHSGLLFDEIRDYLYSGTVSVKSDYFSLSVIIFNLLTYVHPFKGINKKVPKMEDRMIRKLPIIKSDPDLFIPKCYEALSNPSILEQFEKLYVGGDRFILQPNILVAQQQNILVKPQIIIATDQLIMKEIVRGPITKSASSKTRLALTVSGVTIIYDVSLKGNYRVIHSFSARPRDLVFFSSNDNAFLLRDSILYYAEGDYKTPYMVKEFSHLGKLKSRQFGDTLVIITDNMKFEYTLSNIFNRQVAMQSHNIYGGGFSNIDGLFQKVADSSVIFYEKEMLNSVVLQKRLKNLVQSSQTGIVEYLENDKIVYKLFSIKNLQVEFFDCPFSSLRYYDTLNTEILVIPQDDKLSLMRSLDMSLISEFQCSEVSESSVVHCCNAGIVIVNSTRVYLINKK